MTPLDMATCAAVAWAGLATVGGIGAALKLRSDYHWAHEGWQRACGLHRTWKREAIERREKLEADLRETQLMWGEDVDRLIAQRDAANKRWSRAMHLLHTAEKQNKALVRDKLAGELERLVA